MIDHNDHADRDLATRLQDRAASTPSKSPRIRLRRGAGAATLAVGYVRVSTTRQARHGVSLDQQRQAIAREVIRRGMVLVDVIADEGRSGRTSNRPGLREAVRLAKSNRATLVVYSLSRFARNTRDALATIQDLERAGSSLVSVSESLSTIDACGRMVVTMLAALAQLEGDLISERNAATAEYLRSQGRKTGGNVPFGKVAVEVEVANGNGEPRTLRRLEPHPDEARVVEFIMQLHGKGRSLRGIVADLNAEKTPTRTGSSWSLGQVVRIVDREIRDRCPDCPG